MLKLWKRLALAGALASACAAEPAAAQSWPAQLLPGPVPQKVYDQAGRLVGTLLPADAPGGRTKVLVPLPNGEALLNITSVSLLLSGSRRVPDEFVDPNLYYVSADCSGPAYIRARHFLNYAQTAVQASPPIPGATQAKTIRYAARPFVSVDLVSQRARVTEREKTPPGHEEFLACTPLPEPLPEQLVGVARTVTLPSYKLPFVLR